MHCNIKGSGKLVCFNSVIGIVLCYGSAGKYRSLWFGLTINSMTTGNYL